MKYEWFEESKEGWVKRTSNKKWPPGIYRFKEDRWIRVSERPRYPSHVGSDRLGESVNGILNHADGKMYDSKTAYYRSLKEKGFEVRADKEPPKPRGIQTPGGLKADIAQAYKQVLGN